MAHAFSNHAGCSLLTINDDTEQVFTETRRLHPSAVVINLAHMGELALKLVQRIVTECPATAVICASRDCSPDLILKSMRAGARDFMRLPIIEEELNTVIERTAQFVDEHVSNEPKKGGRATAVFSAKGGCGTSLIATNLALLQKSPTVLVDLNLQSGDLELLLGLKPKFSLADVVDNRDRLDDALLERYITPHSKNLSLLAAPIKAEAGEDIEPKHVYEILELLKHRYENVILDTPHNFDSVTISALDHADQILVVLTLEIHAIRTTRRALDIFDRLGYPRKKVKIVVNRWSKNVELDQKQVESFLGERVVGFIQSDYKAAVNSINLGQPLVTSAPNSKVTTDLQNLAATLFDGHIEMPAASGAGGKRSLNSIFRRQTTNMQDLGLVNALDRASLGEAQ
jgi:pilus assembly protein CpaE